MFVHRMYGVAAATLGVLAMGACDDPELNTDLRPAGPPEVLAVLVMTDAASQLVEVATYCKSGDELRPTLVGLPDFTTQQVCPDVGDPPPVTTAYPDGWYIRIMFDELLDPSIEQLEPIIDSETGEETGSFTGSIAAANPVTLECQSVTGNAFVRVDYDGYYSPSGNRITWPVGPSLVIRPNDPTLIATGKQCRVTINPGVILDKQGEDVPADQRGPFEFQVAPITVIATDPTDSLDDDEPAEVDAGYLYFSNFYFQFNTDVLASSFCDDTDFQGTFAQGFLDSDSGAGLCDGGTEKFTLTPPVLSADAGGDWGICSRSYDTVNDDVYYCNVEADCPDAADTCDLSYVYTYNNLAADDEIGIGYSVPLKTETLYTFSLNPGIVLKDRCGATTTLATLDPEREDLLSIQFKTTKFEMVDTNIEDGEVPAPTKKQQLIFTNVVDASTLDPTEYTLTPTPASFAIGQYASSAQEIILGGNYALDTTYTFVLKKGAEFADVYGKTFATTEDQTITWKTQPKLVMTGSSPADLGEIQKITTQQLVGVTLTWNANMDVTTLTPVDDFTFVNIATGADVTALATFAKGNGSGASGNNCSATGLGCQFRLRADLQPGDYKFTLKAGATVSDKLGNVFTQAADLIINFTVSAPAPTVQCL